MYTIIFGRSVCVECEYIGAMKKLRLYKWSFLGLAALCIFVFCSVDLFHTEDYMVGQSHGKASNSDTCPACMFKTSTNSTQPLYTNPILPLEMAWINMVAHPAILPSIKLACQLSIRAPPSDITC